MLSACVGPCYRALAAREKSLPPLSSNSKHRYLLSRASARWQGATNTQAIPLPIDMGNSDDDGEDKGGKDGLDPNSGRGHAVASVDPEPRPAAVDAMCRLHPDVESWLLREIERQSVAGAAGQAPEASEAGTGEGEPFAYDGWEDVSPDSASEGWQDVLPPSQSRDAEDDYSG